MVNYTQLSQRLGIATPGTCRRRLRSGVRARRLVDVRIALAALLKERGWTHTEIAKELHRAPSLVHHYVKMHGILLEHNSDYAAMVSALREVVGSG